jgi:DNA polymerase III subunit gamma/tau
MTSSPENDEPLPVDSAPGQQYVVVARRYRPQVFEELIGQEHVAQALSNAITSNRVGHAYLFTGARGVGKTSAARILAKALNCEKGPVSVPCNVCDTCQSISTGEDVDVLEIDGASNRGIDEIRQLRQNVNVRPSRSRFKIYIIDEVHMLTREAFNALLKTLEEPPEHVKFIFCTTEPTKIPITILSRCQRFDFAGIMTQSITARLRQIVDAEGVQADQEALEVLARRAAGSMRDSQSLLEQLLAFSPGRITIEDVHGMLGTAGDSLLMGMVRHIIDRQSAAALADFDAALHAGVDPALLVEQLFGYFRDCMVASAGCTDESFLYVAPSSAKDIAEASKKLGLHTILAIMQILDQTLSRMRYSTQARILAELALVRICHLEDLDELPALIAELRSGAPASGIASPARSVQPAKSVATYSTADQAVKKNAESELIPPVSFIAPAPLDGPAPLAVSENAVEIWNRVLSRLSGMVVEQARHFDRISFSTPDRLVISFKPGYAVAKSSCERPEQLARFKQALAQVTGREIQIEFTIDETASSAAAATPPKAVTQHQLIVEISKNPMIQRAAELFGATPTQVEPPK